MRTGACWGRVRGACGALRRDAKTEKDPRELALEWVALCVFFSRELRWGSSDILTSYQREGSPILDTNNGPRGQ